MEQFRRKIHQRELDFADKEYELKKLKDDVKQKELAYIKLVNDAYHIHSYNVIENHKKMHK